MKAVLIIFCLIISIGTIEAQGTNARVLANEYYRNARILRSENQYDASNNLIRKSIPLFKESKMWGKYLSAVETLAENFTDQENSDSIKYYWENLAAESVSLIGKNNKYELSSYLALSDFYLKNEQLSKSASMLQEALELIKTKPLGREAFSVKAYTNLALVQSARKLYPEAIQSFELAAKNADVKTVDPQTSANFNRHYASTLYKTGKLTLALEKAEKSLNSYNALYTVDSKNKVELLLLKSDIYTGLKDLKNAVATADDAIKSAVNNTLLQSRALKQKASILILQSKFEESETLLLRAADLAQKFYAARHSFVAEIYLDLAALSLKKNESQKAKIYALKGQEFLYYNNRINLSPICCLKLLNIELKACIAAKEQNFTAFEKKIHEFYELLNRQQFSLNQEEELRYAGKLLFEHLIAVHLEKNKEKAFYWAEFYKIIYRRSLLQTDEASEKLWNLKDSTLTELKRLKLLKLQLLHELDITFDLKNPVKASKLENLILDTDNRIIKSLSVLKKNQAEFYASFYDLSLPSIKDISSKLNKDVLLYFFEANENYYRFVLQNNSLTATAIPKKQLDREIDAVLKMIASKTNQVRSENISKLILPELGAASGLVIVADGKIWNLPFELLEQQNSLVLEKYDTRYIWSYSDLLKSKRNKGTDLCFFSTNYKKQPNNRFQQYQAPYVDAKNWSKNLNINYYRRYFHGDFEYNQQASESNFLAKNIDEFSILHLAFFMHRDRSNPMNSSILMQFQPDSISDGVLHLNELSAISLPLSLISLSNFSDSSGFDEVMATFLLAFEASGAESLLYSAWSVDNAETAKFMRQYYKNLASGMTKSKALRNAKLSFKNKSPYYWASFRLYGQDGTVALRERFRFPWIWVGIGAAILLTIVILIIRLRKRN